MHREGHGQSQAMSCYRLAARALAPIRNSWRTLRASRSSFWTTTESNSGRSRRAAHARALGDGIGDVGHGPDVVSAALNICEELPECGTIQRASRVPTVVVARSDELPACADLTLDVGLAGLDFGRKCSTSACPTASTRLSQKAHFPWNSPSRAGFALLQGMAFHRKTLLLAFA